MANAIHNWGVDIPYMAWLNLCAMLMYMISLHQHGLELDYAEFEEAALTDWCKYVSEEYGIECKTLKDPPKLKNLKDWFNFKEALYAWALDKRGHSLDTPLAYLLHDYVSISDDQYSETYDSISQMLIATTHMHGTHYMKDNAVLHKCLKYCTVGGIGTTQVSMYESTHDGQKAYLAIEVMAKGSAGKASIWKCCYELLEAVRYTNWNGQMLLAKMVDTLEWTFITLAKVGEELSETWKVEYLCCAAAAEGLNTAKAMILGNNKKMNDFVKAKNFLLLNNGCSDSGKKCTQGISAVKSMGQKKKPKKLSSAKKILINDYDPKKDHIPNKEFRALSPDSQSKWNEHRTATRVLGTLTMTLAPGSSDNKKLPTQSDLERYKIAREHAKKTIAMINMATAQKRLAAKSQLKPSPVAKKVSIADATVLKDTDDSDDSKVEVTPPKKKKILGTNLGVRDTKWWIDSSPLLMVVPLTLELYMAVINTLSLIDRKAGTSDIRYVKGLHIRDVHHHSGLMDALVDPNPLQCDLDSHADTCCGSAYCLLIEYKGHVVTVAPYHDEYKPMKVKIVMVTTLGEDPKDGQLYILLIHEALYFGDHLKQTLLNPNQLQANGLLVDDAPHQFDPKSSHLIHEPKTGISIPLCLDGVISNFPSLKPTWEEYNMLPHIELSSDMPWDPHSTKYAEREENCVGTVHTWDGELQPGVFDQQEANNLNHHVCSVHSYLNSWEITGITDDGDDFMNRLTDMVSETGPDASQNLEGWTTHMICQINVTANNPTGDSIDGMKDKTLYLQWRRWGGWSHSQLRSGAQSWPHRYRQNNGTAWWMQHLTQCDPPLRPAYAISMHLGRGSSDSILTIWGTQTWRASGTRTPSLWRLPQSDSIHVVRSLPMAWASTSHTPLPGEGTNPLD